MGRRPSPLIVEFFDRGPKVADSSNRYQHTCKRCGEVFPKGRVEGLIRHLLRKCSQVTQQERRWVFQQISSTSEQPDSQLTQLTSAARQGDAPGQSLTAYQQHEQSALDTLAEVSRRHLDYSSNTASTANQESSRGKTLSEVLAEQAIITELSNYDPVSQPAQNAPTMAPAALDATPLVQAATAASQQLELVQPAEDTDTHGDPTLDPQLNVPPHISKQPLEGIAEFAGNLGIDDFSENAELGGMTFIPKRVKKLKDPPKVPPGHPTPGFGMLQQPKVSKKRKAFDQDRRQQVSDLRKQGACIRCRMLRKPCSPETPCNTCRSVQSARVWTSKCLRTRLADELTLWASNFFQTTMNTAISAADQRSDEQSIPGNVRAHFLSNPSGSISLPATAYGNIPSGLSEDTFGNITLNNEEAFAERLEQNMDQLLDYHIGPEESVFMKATLKQAQSLLEDTAADSVTKSSRSCYRLHDRLLKNVVELWALTQILTSPEKQGWTLEFQASMEQQIDSNEDDSQRNQQDQISQSIAKSSHAYSVISSQLLAGVEASCSKLSKTVMNELERRLLQRQQVSPFATFLSSVILLACVERMTGFFKSLDSDGVATPPVSHRDERLHLDEAPPVASNTNGHEPIDATGARRGQQSIPWPLQNPSKSYWSQGPNFAALLTMLLRIRALPPRTSVMQDGTLAVCHDVAFSERIRGRSLNEHVDEQTKAAVAWLDPLRLNVAELVEKRDSPRDQGMEAWEMKFVGPLFLPENVRS